MLMPTVDSLRVAEGFLRNYARFATERGETHLRAQTMLEWAALAPSASQRGRRLQPISIFARHVQAEDTRHELPPRDVFPRLRPHYRPFLFTEAQIRQLLQHAARLSPRDSLRPWTYCTLFSLLAVTGMRISEALARAGLLTIDFVAPDVDQPSPPRDPRSCAEPGRAAGPRRPISTGPPAWRSALPARA
jgi:site-specific recombinase XerD